MADTPINGDSPEAVALRLLELVAKTEKKTFVADMSNQVNTDRKWILDTYAECMLAVRNPGGR